MLTRSIRLKITIVYMIILALTLSLFSAILYHHVRRSLYENMDTLLRSKAEGIVHAIGTYWAAERLGWKRYGFNPEEQPKDYEVDFATIAQKWVQEQSKDPRLLDIIVKIFDDNGRVVATSKNTQGLTTISRESFNSVLEGKSFFDTLVPSFPTKKFLKFRTFFIPAVQNNKVEYVVQVASPLASIETALNTLEVTLIILLPLTVLLTGMMGTLLAKLTLRPVDSMIKTIHEISAENLKLRILIPESRDEIQKLAATFNDMLGRLDNAFSSQKQLFEDLSHELKTPLTIMKGELEVCLKKMRSPGEYETLLKSSLEEIDKITMLAENLLMIASLESKKLLPVRRGLDLKLLIQGVVNNIKKLASQKEIDITISGEDGMTVMADEHQLKNLFLNLLDNAVKYTPLKGTVTVNIDKNDSSARISVTDTGIGMTEAELKHIFDRFYRVEKSRTSKGFGLGLSIVKSIADAHKGSVEVLSSPGQGTTFTVKLPLSATR